MFNARLKQASSLAIWVILLTLLVFSQQVFADMFDWLKKHDVQLSPAVQGKVLLNGAPVTGATVSRELHYDKEYVDTAISDDSGNFSFPEKSIRSRKPGTLQELRTRQVIVIHYQQDTYLLWYLTTSSLTPQQAIVQRLAALNCDLSDTEQEQVFPNIENPDFPHSTFSICRWENRKS
ncbi:MULTISPECIES: carboxypeptidase-like regulatory domain-containing protein [unclassified Arsukibacterium]|mgnify:CR=1 FL=1|uniref:carboxypeptidase-like regulatory domain-containing protein n=1 Tax=unclassified Arsukibacterium TaxID=2635278 RepID=UPI0025C72A58|nr:MULTISPECIES: carboxypeptidase-like regulatory domain-containing protein [unclassified Arsukibacterium]|tara:strand:+ start:10532 stop:11065 length:534 start_codon:yes stop_codon:yes gene_type:complete